MLIPYDKIGQEIKIGSYIAYGHTLGRCARLRIGKVLNIKENVNKHCSRSSHSFTVIGIEDDWVSSEFPRINLCKKKGTLLYSNRIIVLNPDILSIEYKNFLDSVI